ncbi:Vacuolar amino acid transporter 1 [Ananas comosus]|uniref:Vacuolar amino acid transporter 1 n=1 Tax=Ananas comosus TaxID=4615 RepID=A0A199V1L7_ANACO|nr:Vacuolar amino acid transporter 1 [Ananas comosus]
MARSASEEPLLPLLELKSSEKLAETHQHDDATFIRTCFNGLNALSGVGLLSIPYALSQGGWLSLLLLFIVAMICCYTGLLLQRCMNADPRIRTYPDIGEFAFGYSGRIFVSIFMYLELYLVAIGFLILEGDNLDKLFPDTRLTVGTVSIASKQLFVMLVALIILPTTWLRSLGVLAYVSAGGVLASVIVVFSVLWAATVDGVGFGERGRFSNLSGLPTALGLYTFCYCGHAVLLLCFITCTLNYGSMAILGYLMYGDSVNSQVTLNLPTGKLSSKVAIYTTLINPFSKYALMIAPVATAIEERLITVNKRSPMLLIRSLVVLSTVVIALTIPFFGSLMALIGSLLSIIVSMMLPCICYIKIFGASQVRKVELVLISGILLTGSLVAVTGTYSSLKEIIHQL